MRTSEVSLKSTRIAVRRLQAEGDGMVLVPCEDDYSIRLSLGGAAGRLYWRDGIEVRPRSAEAANLTILDLTHRWQYRPRKGDDELELRVAFSGICALAREIGSDARSLSEVIGTPDGVAQALAAALSATLDDAGSANPALVRQIVRAILTHVILHHGSPDGRDGGTRRLSDMQEMLAKQFMRDNLLQKVNLADIAASAGLSRGYFTKAFAETVGMTPFRWMMMQRVQRAKDMLIEGLPIAEIAAACGFSDQSHLARVFAREVGQSPTAWRRHHGAEP